MSQGTEQRRRQVFTLALMKRCPQFDTCNAPLCPLDPLYPNRPAFKDEDKCTAWRSTRLRIVDEAKSEGIPTAAALRYGGLTVREYSAEQQAQRMRARWSALPEEERQQRLETLKRGRRKLQRKRDGSQA